MGVMNEKKRGGNKKKQTQLLIRETAIWNKKKEQKTSASLRSAGARGVTKKTNWENLQARKNWENSKKRAAYCAI